ncbi:hypothetical protein PFICI_15193 [Pestalotiopsis fici W106-1]|uniref:Thiol-specific monooxygenase n=1 Tax=Pestalotiopsis fici (strain W106-1 / CGMCC3.15140) TaxID=1229662 RepID=W3WGI1_PESFW|nr:uncharacterized protein PFICI_15193 [Pestalotiopsis fici W106-1]ETS73018.1 hypothetical protein PFICI_15193 [Pestalotiopsis fici W106-1]
MTRQYRRVAVIGAGPAGAIATDALAKEQAFDTIRVFDRRSGIGGTWIHTPHLPASIPSLEEILNGTADKTIVVPEILPTVTPVSEEVNSHQLRFSDTAIHENLHSNITPEIMSFSTYPFPDTLSPRTLKEYGPQAPFRHHTIIRDWVENIFRSNGHDKLVELNTTIERAVKQAEEWNLTLRKEVSGRNYWWREKFDALVVASGHYNVPWFPEIKGLLEWDKTYPGSLVHSKHFKGPKNFKGKRVLVVGGSVSSHEIIHEILDVAQAPVYAAVRGDPIPAFGWIPFEHPSIEVRKQISRLDAGTGRVHFADGSHLDKIDHIVFGTGYTFSFPFLPHVQQRISKAYRRLPGVWQHTWDIEDPSLAFIGMLGGGFTFRAYEYQAVAVARHLAGRARHSLPPISEQLEWERARVAEKKGGKDYYSIAPNYKEFFDFLRGFAGDPVEGTTGRKLEPFGKEWLGLWSGMVNHRIGAWTRKKKRAEDQLGLDNIKAKL